ncbi:DUF6931 family protein [Propylenella binzhouense]|uniref:Uncharacterized protein n=1 Tax=Propylenella binzhouense TaxID=2555902 RepID=A0A964WVK5_9HYPH|nr:hypothetical protein [Propylenella binzhouense]MYZ50332.1 hypothetical protein [Propylenella binzhouense]
MSDPDAVGSVQPEDSARPPAYRLRFSTAAELFEAFPAARDDMRAEPDDRPILEFLRGLANGPTPEEAITFAAYLLPRREAVWWAHQCLRQVPDALTAQDQEMLAAAEAWVREPEEALRRAALDRAMAASGKTPGVWVALAAGWSGGSMTPEAPGTVAPPFLTPRAVNAAVLGILARVARPYREETLNAFVTMAVRLTAAV